MKKGRSMQILRKNSYRKPAKVGQLVRLRGELDKEFWARVDGRPFDPENPKMTTIDYLGHGRIYFGQTDLFVFLDQYEVCGKKMTLLLTPEGKKILVYSSVVDSTPILTAE